jgi:CheY-like chemotaxis protein
MKLLIVEDNAPMRQLIRSMAAGLAEEIFECGDGTTACLLYEEQRPDWVLMDIELGEVSGIAATRRIKSAHPEARIIIVTDYNDIHLRLAAKAAGAYDYVLKEDLSVLKQMLTAPN